MMKSLNMISDQIIKEVLHFYPSDRTRYHDVKEGSVVRFGDVTLLVYDLSRDNLLVYQWNNDAENSKNNGIIERNLEGKVKNIQRSTQHFYQRGMHNTKQGSYGWISLIENS
jgi:hypothetical protein